MRWFSYVKRTVEVCEEETKTKMFSSKEYTKYKTKHKIETNQEFIKRIYKNLSENNIDEKDIINMETVYEPFLNINGKYTYLEKVNVWVRTPKN